MNRTAVIRSFSKICYQKENYKKLILLLSDNSEVAIIIYACLLKNKDAVILINQNMDLKVIESYLKKYRPDKIYMPRNQWLKMKTYGTLFGLLDNLYELSMEYFHFLFYDRKTQSEELLNPEIALLVSTSGSTGVRKMVVLSYQNLWSNAKSISKALDIKPGDNGALMLPMAYAYGLSVVNSYLLTNGNLLIPPGSMFEKKYWNYLEEHKVHSFCGVPYTYEIMKKLKIFEREWKDLKLITQAGGALSRNMKRYLLGWVENHSVQYQKTHLAIMYGQTEATARMSTFFLDEFPDKIDSVGKAIPGGVFEIKSTGIKDEVHYRSLNVFMGYVDKREDLSVDSPVLDYNNYCLKTGDLGRIDKDGFLYITGRNNRFVKINGVRVGLDEVERRLTDILDTQIVCLFDWEEEMIFVCISQGKMIDEELVDQYFMKRRIPRMYYSVLRLDGIEYSTNGKINYSIMQQKYVTERKNHNEFHHKN